MVTALCVVFCFWFFALGAGNLTLDHFAFRQAQTAISAFWIARGGPLLGYQTPVLGAPWAIPFEFPIYQYLVALLSKFGLSISVAGRVVSFAFFLLTIWPASVIFRRLGLRNTTILVFTAIFLTSPMYIFWSRSVMIETTAVFFAASWLALLISYQQDRSSWLLASCVLVGTLAMLTKITTFPPFALAGGAFYLAKVYAGWKHERRLSFQLMATTAATVIIPLVISLWWIQYSDGVKELNAEGARLTSRALGPWNYGTLDQRLSGDFWYSILQLRVLPELLGYFYLLSLATIAGALAIRRQSVYIVVCIGAFLSSFLIFTNLHFVHNYYQVANGIFLIAALAIAIDSLGSHFRNVVAPVIFACVLAGQILFTLSVYYPVVTRDDVQSGVYSGAIAAKDVTDIDQSILVFGTDWSSEVPYYAERRGFAVPNWASDERIASIIADPQRYLGEERLGAIVDCLADSDTRPSATLVKDWLATKEIIFEGSGCKVVRP